ncbi:hypothetical protein LguiA_002958 [Lonicera macranthoides]
MVSKNLCSVQLFGSTNAQNFEPNKYQFRKYTCSLFPVLPPWAPKSLSINRVSSYWYVTLFKKLMFKQDVILF